LATPNCYSHGNPDCNPDYEEKTARLPGNQDYNPDKNNGLLSGRSRASFSPSSGSTALSILRRVVVHPSALEPGSHDHNYAAARYRRAKAVRSHDYAHPDNSTQNTGAVCSHTSFVGSLFFISPRTGHGSSQVLGTLRAFSCVSWACAFRSGE